MLKRQTYSFRLQHCDFWLHTPEIKPFLVKVIKLLSRFMPNLLMKF